MTAQTVTGAVARRDEGPAAVVRSSRNWFASILPSHVEPGSFVALSCALLRKNPKLAEAAERNPQSFMSALSECARLGLVPGDTFHLVPFEDRKNETVEITGITDYKGEVQLIYNAGAVASVKAEIIKEADDFQWDPAYMDRPAHRADWLELKGPRGELVGAYAYAVMKDGAISQVVIMGRPEIERHKAMAKGTDRYDSPWKKWPESMWKKTAVHELEKWVPSSPEYRREQLRTAAEAAASMPHAAVPVPLPQPTGQRAAPEPVYDAEIVEDTPNVPSADAPSPAAHAVPATPPPAATAEGAHHPGPAPAGHPAADEAAAGPGPAGRPEQASSGQRSTIERKLADLGVEDPEERLGLLSVLAGRVIDTIADLTPEEATRATANLRPCRTHADLVKLTTAGDKPEAGDE
jgi:recombination protein RecT